MITAGLTYAASPKPDSTVRNAIYKYKHGNYAGCIQSLENYVEKKPSALAYYYLGMSYTQSGKTEQATESYTKSIELAEKENNSYLKKYAELGKMKNDSPEMFKEQESYGDIDLLIKENISIPDVVKKDLKTKHLEYLRNEINAGKKPTF
jgi:tetratricopeptide (TPR) repeat protein